MKGIQLPSIPLDEFSEYAENYYESLNHPLKSLINKDNEYFVNAKAKIIDDLIKSTFKSHQKINIVDVGTGIGIFEKFLQNETRNLFGIDISFKMLQVAKFNNGINRGGYCEANAFNLPFPDNSADIVFLSCVLHHISDQNCLFVIDEMVRICKPGGVILIFEHNPHNFVTQFVVRTTPLDRNARLISEGTLKKLLEKYNHDAYETNYFLYGSRFVDGLINKHLPFLSRFPLGGQFLVKFLKNQGN